MQEVGSVATHFVLLFSCDQQLDSLPWYREKMKDSGGTQQVTR